MNDELSEIERSVVSDVIAGLDPHLAGVLTAQLEKVRVASRVRTAIGFYTYLVVDPKSPRLDTRRRLMLVGAGGDIGGVEVGSLICVEDGELKWLDVYTFGGQSYPHEGKEPLRLLRDREG